jgi:cyclic pyranopterin phosphate synthase
VLSFEEIDRLVDIFIGLGVHRLRLTGGEPLLRRDLPVLVHMLGQKPGLRDLAMTTNGVLLEEWAQTLREVGLDRITISLDSLRPARYQQLTKRDTFDHTLAGIRAARAAGFSETKIDTVILRDFNDDEMVDLIEFGRSAGIEVRFIEYMDVGGATRWSIEQVVPRQEVLARLEKHYGPIQPVDENTRAPADRFRLPDGTVFGVISSTTMPFCRTCDRSRLTADGMWYLCLYAESGVDLRGPLRDGASDDELARLIARTWGAREERGAEVRHEVVFRSALADPVELRENPHLEMHTRGG